MRAFALARRRGDRGYSLIELIIVSGILAVLAGAAMPMATVTMQRQREFQLRRSLREIRTAIDRYKDAVDLGVIGGSIVDPENQGYPPSLDILVGGVEVLGDESAGKMRFLRRIPSDPFTRNKNWGLRGFTDELNSTRWSGDNVYDVYSRSNGVALDGTRYREW